MLNELCSTSQCFKWKSELCSQLEPLLLHTSHPRLLLCLGLPSSDLPKLSVPRLPEAGGQADGGNRCPDMRAVTDDGADDRAGGLTSDPGLHTGAAAVQPRLPRDSLDVSVDEMERKGRLGPNALCLLCMHLNPRPDLLAESFHVHGAQWCHICVHVQVWAGPWGRDEPEEARTVTCTPPPVSGAGGWPPTEPEESRQQEVSWPESSCCKLFIIKKQHLHQHAVNEDRLIDVFTSLITCSLTVYYTPL